MTNISGKAEHEGKPVTFPELAKITGINQETLYARWRNGDRGPSLIRPLRVRIDRPKSSRENDGIEASKENSALKRKNETKQSERRVLLRVRNETRRKERTDAHRDAFSKPLIADDLLSEQERAEIHENVKGRQRWYPVSD